MNAPGFDVEVISPNSPMVDAIMAKQLLELGNRVAPYTSGQQLQSNRTLLASVLNACFWASLAKEEGRPVCSGVTIAAPNDMPDQLLFDKPEPLTRESLVRLGTVAGTSHTLGIHEQGGQAWIWGFTRGSAPFWVTIWFHRMACLRAVIENAGVIALLDNGQVILPKGHLLANPWNVSVQLRQLFGPLFPGFVDTFTFIAQEMSRHGHGGTLLIVPEASREWHKHIEAGYRFSNSSRSLFARLVQRPGQVNPTTDPELSRVLKTDLVRAARQLADLAKIDGAALITTELQLHAFGARISTPDSPEGRPPLWGRNIFGTDFLPLDWRELGGTRHQSAARFVAATNGSGAFVSSHDGGLSALVLRGEVDNRRVEWLRGIETLVTPR